MVAKRVKKKREAKQGELRGIYLLESLQRFFSRPETRLDAQRMIESLSVDAQAYAKQLVLSGPMANATAAKECGFTKEKLEFAAEELLKGIVNRNFKRPFCLDRKVSKDPWRGQIRSLCHLTGGSPPARWGGGSHVSWIMSRLSLQSGTWGGETGKGGVVGSRN